MSGDDITLKEFIGKLEERLDRFEAKLETFVTEDRLKSKIHSVEKIQAKFGLEVEDQEKRIDKVEHFQKTFMFLLKYVGGPLASVGMAVLIAYLTGLI
jgi:hypothetical protein